MDYYELLKVPSSAKQVELDRAYQKLIKEARYDNTINRKDVELAYRTLSDATRRALYDAAKAEKVKTQTSQKIKKSDLIPKSFGLNKPLTWVLGLLLLGSILYYPYRFGYKVKSFSVGDTLYLRDSDAYFGRLVRVEDNHNFGVARKDAYLVKTDTNTEIWFPADDIKTVCYRKN